MSLIFGSVFVASAAARNTPVRVTNLPIPGDATLVGAARSILDTLFALDPSLASNAGLFDDAVRVPSFSPGHVQALVASLDQDLKRLRLLPWRRWPVDQQMDFRWLYACAETARHLLVVEKPYLHRPATWLEPLANNLIAFASYAPDDRERPSRIWAGVPGLLDEIRSVVTALTRRDQETGLKLTSALIDMARPDPSPQARAALEALRHYQDELGALRPSQEFRVIGAEAYRWRLRHALLLDLDDKQLRQVAEQELARVDAEREALLPRLSPLQATADQKRRAKALTRDGLLALYDAVEEDLRLASEKAGFVTLPPGVGPIHSRETPDALVPLTGDGGSMNPPPTYAASNIGYWNVEHFRADWDLETRLDTVVSAEGWRRNGMGPYAAHEGFPGHHLQLSIARLHPNPLRSILADAVQNEGWALYIEEELWRHGGFSDTLEARAAVLRSYRYRIARVIYDVNIETGAWTLQQGADFKHRAEAGKGEIDEDLLRSIQWPTQLISYFAGKRQILELREAYRRKLGERYSDRAFHDAFLAEGSIPIALIRAKLLGEAVPDIEPGRATAPPR